MSTTLQKRALARVFQRTLSGKDRWYRAGDCEDGSQSNQGERVTLASLHSKGYLVRRAWRGVEGDADAAHEYRVSPTVFDAWYKTLSPSAYPDGWPRCVSCGDAALDGHLTCGRVECDEGRARLEQERVLEEHGEQEAERG